MSTGLGMCGSASRKLTHAADGIVDGRKADVSRKRLDRILHDRAVTILLRHGLSTSLHGRNAPDNGQAEKLLKLLLVADLGVEHVLDNDDGNRHEQAAEKANGHIQRTLRA